MATLEQGISRKSAFQLTIATLALFAGGTLYLLFRTDKLLMFYAIDWIGLGQTIAAWRQSVSITLPDWIVYCLPDALWSAAYILVADTILSGHSIKKRLTVAAVIPFVGTVSELLQAAGVMPGTFDYLDILAYAIPYVLYAIIIKTTKK